jgi:ribosomal protein L7/L12
MRKLYDGSAIVSSLPDDFPLGYYGNYEVREVQPMPESGHINREALDMAVLAILRTQGKIQAIKFVRNYTNNSFGLKEAKDWVEITFPDYLWVKS